MTVGPHQEDRVAFAPAGRRTWASVRAAATIAATLLVAACASGPPPEAYDLNAARPAPARPLRAQLRIAEPLAGVDLDSDRILVRTGPQEVATLAGARWSDRLPLLVQARLTQSFENAKLSGQVGRRATTAAAYELDVDIRAFELDVPRSRVRVDLAAKIVALGGGRVVAAQVFTAEAPVASTSAAAASAALDGALSTVMSQIVAFTAARL
jgi:cholesterol transport system auxiliary component